MNQIIFGLKREYWESKRLLIIVPLIITALFFLMALVATWSHHGSYSWLQSGEMDVDISTADKEDTFWFSGVYLGAAWLSAMFYALSSLYTDRRDKSILYWKTMPVSESQTVIAKLIFAIVGFSSIAILISWLSAAVLYGYAYLAFPVEMLPNDADGMSFSKLVVWPILAVVVSLIWCAPVFALLLYVSARAKKMPILILFVSALVVRVVEGVVFSSDRIVSFFSDHSPFSLISQFAKMQSAGEFLQTYLFSYFPSLVLGLLIAGLLIWRAAWCRNHDFEI